MSTKPPIAARIPSAILKILLSWLHAPPEPRRVRVSAGSDAPLLGRRGARPAWRADPRRSTPTSQHGPDRARPHRSHALKRAGPRPSVQLYRDSRCGHGRRRRSSARQPRRRRPVRLQRRANPDRLELLLDVFLRDGAAPAAAGCNQKHDRYQERACKHLTRQYPLERIPTRPPLRLAAPAPVAQGIERCPAEAEVACSNHAGRMPQRALARARFTGETRFPTVGPLARVHKGNGAGKAGASV